MKIKFLIFILGIVLITNFVNAIGMPDPFGDYDSDGVLNINDNCYYVYNPFQTDNNANGFGNCCDPIYIMTPHNVSCDNPSQVFCDDGICNNGENSLTCPTDCTASVSCGNNILEAGEQCDNGISNGVLCDNSVSSCNYCDSFCNLVTLPFINSNNATTFSSANWCGSVADLSYLCEPNWKCTGWSECTNSVEKRVCTDTNNCNFKYNKPIETIDCDVMNSKSLIEKSSNLGIYLGISLLFTLLLLGLLIVILIKK